MKILVACDKFKGSLEADEVGKAIAEGILLKNPNFVCQQQPLADGGDGTLKVLNTALNLQKIDVNTIDPLNRLLESTYLTDDTTAYIELASASGIVHLQKTELDVRITNTIGTGKVLLDALKNGYKEIILGLGGSCSNDVGLGIAYALGFQFLNENEKAIIPVGGNLMDIKNIIRPKLVPAFNLTILCDVENLLYGSNGAAYVYAKQKGADVDTIKLLDEGMRHIATLILQITGKDISTLKGGGAAGGIAAGLFGLLDNVKIQNGFDYIAEKLKLNDIIQHFDCIITGEGKFDNTSLDGKVVGKLLDICKSYNKPLIVISGLQEFSDDEINALGIDQSFDIMGLADSFEDAIQNGEKYLKLIGEQLFSEIIKP